MRSKWEQIIDPSDDEEHDLNVERQLQRNSFDRAEQQWRTQWLQEVRGKRAAQEDVAFEKLDTRPCAIIDAASLGVLSKFSAALVEPITPPALSAIRRALATGDRWGMQQEARHLFDILERLIVYEFLAVDKAAADGQSAYFLPSELIRMTTIPEAVYQATGEVLKAAVRSGSWAQQQAGREPHRISEDERYLDRLQAFDPTQFAYSNESAARALLYLELSHRANVPLVLHPRKRAWFKVISQALEQDALALVHKLVDGAAKAMVSDQLTEFLVSSTVMLPPLAEYLLRIAEQRRVSIAAAIEDVRASPEARSFRDWLWQIQKQLIEGDRPNLIAAARMLREVEEVTKEWTKSLDVRCGVKYERRQFSLESIPVIGPVFKLADRRTIAIKDPILNRKRYLVFISDWYSTRY